MRTKIIFPIVIASTIFLSGCKQIQQLATFAKCEFRLKEVKNITFNGINVDGKSSFSVSEMSKISKNYLLGKAPLEMLVNVEVKNPNASSAALNRTLFIAELTGTKLVESAVDQRVEVAANGGVSTLPIKIRVDLKKVLSGKSAKDVSNLVLALGGANSEDSDFKMKLKPSFNIAGVSIGYPGYITLGKEFKAQ